MVLSFLLQEGGILTRALYSGRSHWRTSQSNQTGVASPDAEATPFLKGIEINHMAEDGIYIIRF